MEMTPTLRARLTAAYESERPNWGDKYTDHFLDKLAQLPDGPFEPAGHRRWIADRDELLLEPADAVELGLDYFCLEHLAE